MALALASGEQAKPLPHPGQNLRCAHHSHPRPGQLDRERYSIGEMNDFSCRRKLGFIQLEPRTEPLCSIDEKLESRLQIHRSHLQNRFRSQAQPFTARSEEMGLRGSFQPLLHSRGRCHGRLLQVVKNDEASTASCERVSQLRNWIAFPEWRS
jgi:hypothetical protein